MCLVECVNIDALHNAFCWADGPHKVPLVHFVACTQQCYALVTHIMTGTLDNSNMVQEQVGSLHKSAGLPLANSCVYAVQRLPSVICLPEGG